MNCRQAQQLISPYVDQELTGQQMLDMQAHFAQCPQCAEEYHVVRQVKTLLCSLSAHSPNASLERCIVSNLDRSTQRRLHVTLQIDYRPQRGRRLATALALACLSILTVAAPFAPENESFPGLHPMSALSGDISLLSSLPIFSLHTPASDGNRMIAQPVMTEYSTARSDVFRYPTRFAGTSSVMPLQNLNAASFDSRMPQSNTSMASFVHY